MQSRTTLQGGQFHIRSEHGVVSWNLKFVNQILPLHLVVRMFLELDTKIKISRFPSTLSLGTLSCQPNTLPLTNSAGDFHGVGLDFACIATAERDLTG